MRRPLMSTRVAFTASPRSETPLDPCAKPLTLPRPIEPLLSAVTDRTTSDRSLLPLDSMSTREITSNGEERWRLVRLSRVPVTETVGNTSFSSAIDCWPADTSVSAMPQHENRANSNRVRLHMTPPFLEFLVHFIMMTP